MVSKITKEELETGYKGFLTVGELRKFLVNHNIQDSSKILIQRVEDMYYEDYSWKVYEKKSNGPCNQYTPAHGCVKYHDDNFLFIDLHI